MSSDAFFKVLPETKEHELAYNIWHYVEAWKEDDFENEFREVIGVGCDKNLVMWPHVLQLKEIPEGTRDQFKKDKVDGGGTRVYEAKVRSPLNKAFLEIVKKYDLKYYEYSEFVWRFERLHSRGMVLHPFNHATEFCIQMEKIKPEAWNYFKFHPSLEEISETEFYTWKAEQAKEVNADAE